MRSLAIIATLVLLAGCGEEGTLRKPQAGRLYFPSGLVHLPTATGDGYLVVASSNFDNRYDYGLVTSIDLSAVGLPAFGAAGEVVDLPDLKLPAGPDGTHGARERLIETFASGDLGFLARADGARVFIPTRGAHNRLHAVDLSAADGTLSCAPASPDGVDCTSSALSLSANEENDIAKPNAPAPMAAKVDPATGDVYVVHRVPAHSPLGSDANPESFLVHTQAEPLQVTDGDFSSIGRGGANSVVLAGRYAFLTGYYYGNILPPLLRAVDRNDPARVFDLALESSFRSVDGRGSALSSDGKRLYLIGRSPDALIVVSLSDVTGERPTARAIRGVPLPDDPNHLVVIPRPGRGDLVAVTCTQAGSVVIYDEDLGALAGHAYDVGGQPFGITAVMQPSGGARLYVTHFSDGQVGVYDLPDLADSRSLRLVARLGESQRCITDEQGC